MQIGQTYEILVTITRATIGTDGDMVDRVRKVKGKLIQITPYLYVFEYKDRQGNTCITSISKSDWTIMHKRKGMLD